MGGGGLVGVGRLWVVVAEMVNSMVGENIEEGKERT